MTGGEDGSRVDVVVDGGQSSTRLGVVGGTGVALVATGGGLPQLAEDDGPTRVAALVGDLVREADLEVAGLAAGLTGFGEVRHRAGELATALAATTGASRVVLASDVVTSHLGALGGQPGVVAAIGTGAVVLGVGEDGRTAKVDGWGHVLGDLGSGYDLGRRGLVAALEHHDGRGGSAVLAAAAERRFGSLDGLAGRILGEPERVRTIASFCPEVTAAAEAGDDVAGALVRDAADHLTRAILAAADATVPRGTAGHVSWAGSLLTSTSLLLTPVAAALAAVRPELVLAPPLGGSLDGAGRLLDADARTLVADLVHAHDPLGA
jgi:glucosamine kinase